MTVTDGNLRDTFLGLTDTLNSYRHNSALGHIIDHKTPRIISTPTKRPIILCSPLNLDKPRARIHPPRTLVSHREDWQPQDLGLSDAFLHKGRGDAFALVPRVDGEEFKNLLCQDSSFGEKG